MRPLVPSLRLPSLALALCSFSFAPAFAEEKAGAEKYSLEISAPDAKVGAASSAHLSVKAAKGYHINRDYPTSLKLTAPDGVALAKAAMTVKDGDVKIEETRASVEVGYTARDAGKKTINGTLSFAVCSDTTCDPRREKISFTVDVK